MAQRLHEKDLVGHVLAKVGYEHLCLPLVAEEEIAYSIGHESWTRKPGDVLIPTMYPPEAVEDIRRNLGPSAFATQYQQRPIPPGGALVNPDDFSRLHPSA